MGLQIRVRHALGTRMVELEPRDAKGAIRVGRAAECELSVPSASVDPVHCILYVKEGQWFVRPANPKAALRVNSASVTDATAINNGDRIVLGRGADAPTLELDPLGVGRGAKPSGRTSSRPAAPKLRPPPASSEQLPPPPPPPPPQPVAVPVHHDDTPHHEDEHWHLEGVTNAPQPAPARSRRRPRSGGGGGHFGLVLAWGVGIGAAFGVLVVLIVLKTSKDKDAPTVITQLLPAPANSAAAPSAPILPDAYAGKSAAAANTQPAANGKAAVPVPVPTVTSRPVEKVIIVNEPTTRDTTIFNFNQPGANAPRPKVSQAQSKLEAHADAMTKAPKPAAPDNPLKKEDAWRAVEATRQGDDYKTALCALENYRITHPGLLEPDIKAYADETLDKLWWKRIKELCDKRDQTDLDIKDIEQQIEDETMPLRKEELQKARELLVEQKATAVKQMADESGYDAEDAPDPANQADIDELRKKRDPDRFAKWSRIVLDSIKAERRLPWE